MIAAADVAEAAVTIVVGKGTSMLKYVVSGFPVFPASSFV